MTLCAFHRGSFPLWLCYFSWLIHLLYLFWCFRIENYFDMRCALEDLVGTAPAHRIPAFERRAFSDFDALENQTLFFNIQVLHRVGHCLFDGLPDRHCRTLVHEHELIQGFFRLQTADGI